MIWFMFGMNRHMILKWKGEAWFQASCPVWQQVLLPQSSLSFLRHIIQSLCYFFLCQVTKPYYIPGKSDSCPIVCTICWYGFLRMWISRDIYTIYSLFCSGRCLVWCCYLQTFRWDYKPRSHLNYLDVSGTLNSNTLAGEWWTLPRFIGLSFGEVKHRDHCIENCHLGR